MVSSRTAHPTEPPRPALSGALLRRSEFTGYCLDSFNAKPFAITLLYICTTNLILLSGLKKKKKIINKYNKIKRPIFPWKNGCKLCRMRQGGLFGCSFSTSRALLMNINNIYFCEKYFLDTPSCLELCHGDSNIQVGLGKRYHVHYENMPIQIY